MARTETDEGIENTFGIAPERVTETPPEGAGLEMVTVQEVLAFDARAEAAHCREETTGAVTSEMVAALEEPLREAVTVALWAEVNWPAVAVKFAVVEPAATETDGEATLTLPVVWSPTVTPPVPAGLLSVTVQVDAAPGFNDAGVQTRELIVICCSTVIVPPVAAIARAVPLGSTPITLLSPTASTLEEVTVADSVATTPLAIALAFMPLTRHVTLPKPAAQLIVLPALVEAAPGVTVIFENAAEYVNVH